MKVYTLSGKPLMLEDKALASGGEGKVCVIKGYPKKVVKIYHDSSNAQAKEKKITEMVRISQTKTFKNMHLEEDVAWPLSPLHDAQQRLIGFGMNRISASNELDDLYVYPPAKNRRITIMNKLDCAISLCEIVEKMHSLGVCFGDGNPVNLKIDKNYKVYFLDADSFHFCSGGTQYKCEVCAPGYVAPELIRKCKGTTYAQYPGETFNVATDCFSLAIHIFRLLFNGVHPFICQWHTMGAGSFPAPKPIDRRVESGETPFFRRVPNYQAPSYAPSVNAFPSYIRSLFERAFVEGHTNPARRPSAKEWKQALTKFKKEVTQCRHNPMHYYWQADHKCPYCEAEQNYNASTKPRSVVPPMHTSRLAPPSRAIPPAPPIPTPPPPPPIPTPPPIAPTPPPRSTSLSGRSSATSRGSSGVLFWLITVVFALFALAAFGESLLPELYYSITKDSDLTSIGVVGSCITGFIGTLVYNICWAPGKYRGGYRWHEYVLSLLTTVGFMFGFGILMAAVVLVLAILSYAISIFAVIAIVAALFSGG